jgi:Family of unknown function (DUF6228)
LETLILDSPNGISATLLSRRFNDEGWLESYSVLLQAPTLSATRTVENPPFGQPPLVLFRDIAAHWNGWEGTKKWDAVEGEFKIFAKTDLTGHITLTFELPSSRFPPTWAARVDIMVEAGQLDKLARDAGAFFNNVA